MGNHTGVAVDIFRKGDAQNGGAGAGGGLGKGAHHGLVPQQQGGHAPYPQEHHRGRREAEQAESGVEIGVEIHAGDGLEQADRQGALKDVSIGGLVEGVVQHPHTLQKPAQQDDQKNRYGGVEREYKIIHGRRRGYLLRFWRSSASTSEMRMPWGHTDSQLRQARQFSGRLSAARALTRREMEEVLPLKCCSL